MDTQLIFRTLSAIIFGLCFTVLGLMIWLRRRPVIISVRLFALLFTLALLPVYFTHAPGALELSPAAMVLAFLMMIAPFFLLIAFSGDFLFFNASEEVLERSIKHVLDKHNISFAEGKTKGLLAPGGESRRRKIVTLDLTGRRASLRYLLNKKVLIGHVRILNKNNVPEYNDLLEDLKNSLRSQEVAPGSTLAYLVGIGLLIMALQLMRYLR